MSKSTRGYLFTKNHYGVQDEELLKVLDAQYVCYGKEVAPTTGTPHLQGYVYFRTAITFASALSKLPGGSHLEAARGTGEQNRAYCSKEGDFWEKGQCPVDKKRAAEDTWNDAYDSAKLGDFDAIPRSMYVRYLSNWKRVRTDVLQADAPPDLDGPCGEWYYGPPGTGKSYKARHDNPGAYIKNCNKWWDGYVNQDTVVMDELNAELAKALGTHLKNWTDAYPFMAEVKGGSMFIRPKKFIVCSNYSIEDCFADDLVLLDAIKRRFKVTHFSNFFTKTH